MADTDLTARRDLRTIGSCRLLRKLSVGGMGEVYLAEQVRLGGRRVAVKVLRPEDEDISPQPGMAETHFRREATLLGRFAHKNIVPVHDSGMDRGQFYLVMEYVPDGSLADAIRGRSRQRLSLPADVPTVVDLIGQVAEALHYAHENGVVHRDVKPGNILVQIESNGHWHLLLADFGLACEIEATVDDMNVTGTVAYMAPEQFSGGFSPASDQYSLAILTYQLLTAQVPFSGDMPMMVRGHLSEPPSRPSDLNPTVPEAISKVVLRALAKRPGERYPTVAAYAAALRAAASPGSEPERWEAENQITLVMGAPEVEVEDTIKVQSSTAAKEPAPHVPADAARAAAQMATTLPPWAPAPRRAPKSRPTASRIVANPPQGLRFSVVLAACTLLLVVLGIAGPGLLPASAGGGPTLGGSLAGVTSINSGVPGGRGTVAAPAAIKVVPTEPSAPSRRPGATPLDQASPSPHALTVNVASGQRFRASFTFVNAGKTTWSSAKGYALSCASKRHAHGTCLGFSRISFGGYTVTPGGHFTFTVMLTAPPTPGAYPLWLSVGRNGGLFDGQDMLLQVKTYAVGGPNADMA